MGSFKYKKIRSYEDVKIRMERKRELKHFRDLDVYQKAFKAAMRIYEITKSFPVEETRVIEDE
jgi:hypothetical protein